MSLKNLQEIVADTKSSLHCLTPQAAKDLLSESSNALVIDVREPGEVAEKRAAGTINIPRGVLEMKITDHTTDPDRLILLHCATGGRAALSAAALKHMGFRNVSIIDCSCDELITHFGVA
ncbi:MULTISPECIES: rhodanese-like domain-containing protein [Marinobacter]|uniref:Rhodanese-like domain-containing protein n=1 Tax=Marinobacter suaedae TaxID=3057675 RepID=A0ABT8VXB9_9GAMM|nr:MULTISPECIES: rhodanese-like domain-containing protein [unclassified Marinobacter]MBZ2168760.1 rhodanese-like domain-containing protein [Marinobacter sp. F4216]MDO3720637.1 rhodanese-like domain-containing protein [Marinobacter sp. chi1]